MREQVQMMYCESCGAANPDEAQQCFACHRPLVHEEPAITSREQDNATSDEVIPEFLDNQYKILACVGSGGFGAVYKARAIQDNDRLVAIKEIRLRNLKPQEVIEATDSFNREVQILSTLTHPNLPRVYTHFTDPDHWYLVMDYIEGQTLEAYLQANGGKLAQDEALAIGIQLCEVLEYLHTREPAIIFRDLKPSNVMISLFRQVYLIDFGTARLFKPGRPRDTIAFGSPGYAAPEQYGKAQTTPRSDLYSLGAVLHQMLTGLDPAEASFQFKPLRKCIKGVPDELDQLVTRLLEREADKRPESAAEVKAVLERATVGSWRRLYEQPGTLSSPIYQPGNVFGQPPPESWTTSKPSLAQVQQQLGIPVTPSASSTSASGKGKISRRVVTGALVTLGIAGSAGLLNLVKAPPTPPLRRSYPPDYRPPAGYTYKVYKGHKSRVSSVVWSSMTDYRPRGVPGYSGTYVASASFDQTIQIWSGQTGHHITKFTAHTAPIKALACSPNGQFMASADEWTCYVWNPFTGQIYLTHTRAAGAPPIAALAWSQDSQHLAIAEGPVHVYQITLQETKATAQLMTTYQGHTGRVNCLLWSAANSEDVVTGGADGTIQIWDSKSRQRKAINASSQGRPIQALCQLQSFTGTFIFAHDNKIQVWNSLNNTLISTYAGHIDAVTALASSKPGLQIASASLDGAVHVWDLLSGNPRFVYRKHRGPVRAVAWQPGADIIASGGDDKTVRIWRGPPLK